MNADELSRTIHVSMPTDDDGKIITDPSITPFHPHDICKYC
jgi:hypothetical protein